MFDTSFWPLIPCAGREIAVTFTAPTVRTAERVPASTYLTDVDAKKLGTGATAFWAAPNKLVFVTSSDATIVPKEQLNFREPIKHELDPTVSTPGPDLVEPPASPPTPWPSETAVCRRTVLRASIVSGAGPRPVKYKWGCESSSPVCNLIPLTGVDLTAITGPECILPANLAVDTLYNISVVAENFLGGRSEPLYMVFRKSAGRPPAVSVDGGTTVYSKPDRQLIVKAVAQRTVCKTDDPAFLTVGSGDYQWIRSADMGAKWTISGVTLPATVDVTKPTLAIPAGVLRPGVYDAVFTATDNSQSPALASSVSVKVIVEPEPLVARIAGASSSADGAAASGRTASSTRPITLDSAPTSDPSYSGPAAAAAGLTSKQSHKWTVRNKLTGMKPGDEYDVHLEVTSERFQDGAAVETVKSHTTATLRIADPAAPDVNFTEASPKDPMYILPGQEVSSRGSETIRTLLPRGEGPNNEAKLVVRISDEFGAYADAPLSAIVTLDATDIDKTLDAAAKTLVTVNGDGDVEASLSSLTTISKTVSLQARDPFLSHVCQGNEQKTLQSAPSTGTGSPLAAAGLTLPVEIIERARSTLGTEKVDSAGAGIVLYHYLRNPYPTVRDLSATGTKPENISITATVIEASVMSVAITNLATPMRFEIPFPEGASPALPLDLLFFNTTRQAWSSCSNVTLEQRTGPQNAPIYYAIGTCDHLTAFSIGTAEPRLTAAAAATGGSTVVPGAVPALGDGGGPAGSGSGGSSSASATSIAVGVAVGGVAVIAALALGVWCLAAGGARGRRRRSRNGEQNHYNQAGTTDVYVDNVNDRRDDPFALAI
eukprot:tig00000133_g7681.t1